MNPLAGPRRTHTRGRVVHSPGPIELRLQGRTVPSVASARHMPWMAKTGHVKLCTRVGLGPVLSNCWACTTHGSAFGAVICVVCKPGCQRCNGGAQPCYGLNSKPLAFSWATWCLETLYGGLATAAQKGLRGPPGSAQWSEPCVGSIPAGVIPFSLLLDLDKSCLTALRVSLPH